MTFYAYYDYTQPDPVPVTGWYDTTDNPVLPSFQNLLQLTEDQWDNRLPDINNWAVSGGALVPYMPPLPLPQQAQLVLASYVAQGITVTSSGLPALDGTYALDSVSTAQIFQIGTFANSFGIFPNGGPNQPYPDISSAVHVFNVPTFVSFLLAVASLMSDLQTQTGIMSAGGTPAWPPMTATIV